MEAPTPATMGMVWFWLGVFAAFIFSGTPW